MAKAATKPTLLRATKERRHPTNLVLTPLFPEKNFFIFRTTAASGKTENKGERKVKRFQNKGNAHIFNSKEILMIRLSVKIPKMYLIADSR